MAVGIINNHYIIYYAQYKYFANMKDKQSNIHLYNQPKPYISEIKRCFTNFKPFSFELWLMSMFKITVLK